MKALWRRKLTWGLRGKRSKDIEERETERYMIWRKEKRLEKYR